MMDSRWVHDGFKVGSWIQGGFMMVQGGFMMASKVGS